MCFGNFFGTHKVNHEWCKDFSDKMVHPGIGSNVGPSTNDQGRRDACMWSVLKQGFILVWFLKGNPSLWFFYNFCKKNKAAKTTNSQFSSSLSSWNVRWENSEKNSAKDYVVSWIQIKKLNQHLIYVFVYIYSTYAWICSSKLVWSYIVGVSLVGHGPHSVADFFGKEVRDCSKLSTLLVMELKKNGPRRRQTGGLAGHWPAIRLPPPG